MVNYCVATQIWHKLANKMLILLLLFSFGLSFSSFDFELMEIWNNSFRYRRIVQKYIKKNSKLVAKYHHTMLYVDAGGRDCIRNEKLPVFVNWHRLHAQSIWYVKNDDFSLALVKQFMIICLTTMCHEMTVNCLSLHSAMNNGLLSYVETCSVVFKRI